MSAFSLWVTVHPVVTSVSCPPAPGPPVPSPDDHRNAYRIRCLVLYHEARLAGLDHQAAIKEASRLLKLGGHPWHYRHVVEMEINAALGRRPGRVRRGRSGVEAIDTRDSQRREIAWNAKKR
jgi:hypothetical protein